MACVPHSRRDGLRHQAPARAAAHIGNLLSAEIAEKRARSIKYQLTSAPDVDFRIIECAPVTGAEREHDQQHCGPSGVCGARLRDSREIGGGDPRLHVSPDSTGSFVVAPFDVLALRRGHASAGDGWPDLISLAYQFRRGQPRSCRKKISAGICRNVSFASATTSPFPVASPKRYCICAVA
jgi:hypothetical protein